MLFFRIKDFIPKDSHYYMKDKLDSASSENIERISRLEFKNPMLALSLSLLGPFGIDRFYKGDILIGSIKMMASILFIFLYLVADLSEFDTEDEKNGYAFIVIILAIIIFIWHIIDSFLVYKGIKKDNLLKIQIFL